MKKILVSVKDELKGFGIIAIEDSEAVAYRDFSNAVNSNEVMKMNLKDYGLYQLGIFDTELGTIENCIPKLIVDAASVARKKVD